MNTRTTSTMNVGSRHRGKRPNERDHHTARISRGLALMNWPTALLLLLPLAGCHVRDFAPRAVAGHIGCMPADITITDVDAGWGGAAFLATCFDETFICSMDGHCTRLREGPMGDIDASNYPPPCTDANITGEIATSVNDAASTTAAAAAGNTATVDEPPGDTPVGRRRSGRQHRRRR